MLSRVLDESSVRRDLALLDKLRELLQNVDKPFALPSIVVIGDQSAGKSSVLEALSGVELPRAQGTCTRCPCEVRLKQVAAGGREYAELSWRNAKGQVKKRSDLAFAAVGPAILAATTEVAGKESISDKPLYLTVYKCGVLDLTLIDLPGIVTVAREDQDSDMPKKIEAMIKAYITDKAAIILNVMPAVGEWQARTSLKWANEADPNQERSLIVASKCDIHNPNIGVKLRGISRDSVKSKLGIIAVRARTQIEIDRGTTFEEARAQENEFFQAPEFAGVPASQKGTEQLAKRLAQLQRDALKKQLPGILDKVEALYNLKVDQLSALPEVPSDRASCRRIFSELMSQLQIALRLCCEGNSERLTEAGVEDCSLEIAKGVPDCFLPEVEDDTPADAESKREEEPAELVEFTMYSVSRLLSERSELMQSEVHDELSDFLSPEYAKLVAKGLRHYQGSSLPNFLSFPLCQSLVGKEVKKLHKPCASFIDDVHAYLSVLVPKIVADRFRAFPQLKARLLVSVGNVLKESRSEAQRAVDYFFRLQLHVSTLNHYYMDTVNKIREALHEKKEQSQLAGSAANNQELSDFSCYRINDIELDLTGVDDRVLNNFGSPQDSLSDESNFAQSVLDMQINVLAYCKVVKKVIVDDVAKAAYLHFVTDLQKQLSACSFSDDQLLAAMDEPNTRHEREQIQAEVDALREAMQVIQE